MALPASRSTALSHIRICDFTGQLAGAGATRFLAAFGAQVIRDRGSGHRRPLGHPPRHAAVRRRSPRHRPRRRVQQPQRREARHHAQPAHANAAASSCASWSRISDVVTRELRGRRARAARASPTTSCRELKPDIIYVSNCGLRHRGPYSTFKTWGPIVQAVLRAHLHVGLPDMPPAGWGFSYMDHMGGNFMAVAILAALIHRNRTGEGQWVDMSLHRRRARPARPRPARLHGERPPAAPARACPTPTAATRPRWRRTTSTRPTATTDGSRSRAATTTTGRRLARSVHDEAVGRRPDATRRSPAASRDQDELDERMDAWTRRATGSTLRARLRAAGVPASVQSRSPEERIDHDPGTTSSGSGRSRTTPRWATSASTASRTPLGDRLVDRARRAAARRAQRRRVRRPARPRRTTRFDAPRGHPVSL